MIHSTLLYTDSPGLWLSQVPGCFSRWWGLGQRCRSLSRRRPTWSGKARGESQWPGKAQWSDGTRGHGHVQGTHECTHVCGYQEQGCTHLSLMHLGRHYRASWTWVLCTYMEGNFPRDLEGGEASLLKAIALSFQSAC